jgi:hypothetical protein
VGAVDAPIPDSLWDDEFLMLDGPELLRITHLLDDVKNKKDPAEYFPQLIEYIHEWGELLAETGKGLMTLIRAEMSTRKPSPDFQQVAQVGRVHLLFLPTNTGQRYLSREEERLREKQAESGLSPQKMTASTKKFKPGEGGVEVLVEITTSNELRIRARRCNMADDTVIKELSEETVLKRLEEAVEVWKKDHRP